MTIAQKITALAALSSADAADLLPIVDNPAGGAATKKMTVSDLIRSYETTVAETAAGVTPTDFTYEPGHVLRYGVNATPGTTDITTAFTNGLSVIENRGTTSQGRGELFAPFGQYKITSGLSPAAQVDLVGEGKRNTRLEFALTSAGDCINLVGTTGIRKHNSVKKLRIDGTNCTDPAVNGILLDWNQRTRVLDDVKIFGGNEAGGANTGLKHGLKFVEDGNEWILSIRDLFIEGCHGDQLVMDTQSAGSHNIINYWGGATENGKERNVVLIGPDDDVNSFLINFHGYTFEGASRNNTGVNADLHIEGVTVNLNVCWFESNPTPNWPTYQVYVLSGRANVNGGHVAHSQTAFYCGGIVTFSNRPTIRSSTAAIHIPTGGRAIINGEVEFLGAGTPITFAGTGELEWNRDRLVRLTDNHTILQSDWSTVFNNEGAKKDITITLSDGPRHAWITVETSGLTVRNATYRWILSSGGTTEYYLELAAGGDPGIDDPTKFYRTDLERTRGTVGSLADLEWDYGDNDTLGFSTIYYRDSGADPDSFTSNTLWATYKILIDPVGFLIIPGNGQAAITSDGAFSSNITLRSNSELFWLVGESQGTWT